MVYLFAIGAAFANAVGSVMQRKAAMDEPSKQELSPRLILDLLHRPAYLAGVGGMVGGFVLQLAALARAGLATVQPVLVLDLLFVLAILAVWWKRPLGKREWTAALAVAVGLSVFLLVAHPQPAHRDPHLLRWAATGAVLVLFGGPAVAAAERGSPSRRALWFGLLSAGCFALAAALARQTMTMLHHGLAHLVTTWTPYALVATGGAGVFLAANAFESGPLAVSQAALEVADPLGSVVLGVALFGEHLNLSFPAIAGEVGAFTVMTVGVIVLARSPLIAQTHGAEAAHSKSENGRAAGSRRG